MTEDEFGLLRARELEAKIEELGADKVAAFIGEPIQGAGGVIVPPKTYWPEIQRICRKHGILLIADEVITGFGRTGNWFGSQTFDIKPDIMTIAKGLSSGYAPIGGSIVSDDVAAVVAEGGEFFHGYTYSGHPVACAVALENLRIWRTCASFRKKGLSSMCATWPIPIWPNAGTRWPIIRWSARRNWSG